jgi:hypothetical protein
MEYFWPWIYALFRHSGWLASGVAGVVFQILERRRQVIDLIKKLIRWPEPDQASVSRPEGRFKKWVVFALDNAFWVGGVVCILLAFFLTWRDEHRSLLTSNANLITVTNLWKNEVAHTKTQWTQEATSLRLQLENSGPRFSGEIEQTGCIGETHTASTVLFVQVTLRNAGAPSVAEGWHADLTTSKLKVNLIPAYIPSTILTLGEFTFDGANNSLLDKTIKPIVGGGFVRGWLMYPLADININLLNDPDMHLVIHYMDNNRKLHDIETYKPIARSFGADTVPSVQSYPDSLNPFTRSKK